MRPDPVPAPETMTADGARFLMKREEYYRSIGLDRVAVRMAIVQALPQPLGTVLEIGTGKGFLTRILAAQAEHVTTIDLDAQEQRYAEQHLSEPILRSRVTFVPADAEALPFEANSFDTVVSAYTFHHLKDPFRSIDEMIRVGRTAVGIAEFSAKGFAAVKTVHEMEGFLHEQNGIDFSRVAEHCMQRGFTSSSVQSEWSDMFVIDLTQRR